jgi:hypothetical protein
MGDSKKQRCKKNVTFKIADVQKLAEYEFDQITPEEWQKRCQHVITVEKRYMESEITIDNHTETQELIIHLGDSDTDSDDYYTDSE